MPDLQATATGIAVMAIATYLTRIAGYFLGSRVASDSLAARVLDVLPGAALAGVLALSLAGLPATDGIVVVVAVVVYLVSRRTLLAIGVGLAVAVAKAHLLT